MKFFSAQRRSRVALLRWLICLSPAAGGLSSCRLGYEVRESDGAGGLGGANDADGGATGGNDVGSGGRNIGSGGDASTGGAMGGEGPTDTGGDSAGGSATGGDNGQGGMGGMGDVGAPCDPTSFFCSSFTDPLFADFSGFDVQNSTCVVELVTAPVFTESTALRSHAPVGCNAARLNYAFDAEVASGPLSLRAWFYLPNSVVLDNDLVIVELHDATIGVDGKASINLGVGDTVNLEVTTGILPRNSVSSGSIFPRDTWNCVVLRTEVSDTAGSVEVELNGMTVHSLTDGDALPAPGFARAMAGIYNYGANEVEIYLDDVGIAESALTCP